MTAIVWVSNVLEIWTVFLPLTRSTQFELPRPQPLRLVSPRPLLPRLFLRRAAGELALPVLEPVEEAPGNSILALCCRGGCHLGFQMMKGLTGEILVPQVVAICECHCTAYTGSVLFDIPNTAGVCRLAVGSAKFAEPSRFTDYCAGGEAFLAFFLACLSAFAWARLARMRSPPDRSQGDG